VFWFFLVGEPFGDLFLLGKGIGEGFVHLFAEEAEKPLKWFDKDVHEELCKIEWHVVFG